jgi:hypothetical protein
MRRKTEELRVRSHAGAGAGERKLLEDARICVAKKDRSENDLAYIKEWLKSLKKLNDLQVVE